MKGGTQITKSSTITGDTTIYAQWTRIISSGDGYYIAAITVPGIEVYYVFTPTTSGAYKIYASENSGDAKDTYVNLYKGTDYWLASDDDSGTDQNFSLTYWLERGQEYYFRVKYFSSYSTGGFKVRLEPTTATTYTITYKGNASGVTSIPSSDRKVSMKPLTLSDSTPVRTGYVFLGWDVSDMAKIPTYYKTGNKFNSVFSFNADTSLYAVWGVRGDANMDGSVDLTDANLALKCALKLASFTEHEKKLMDYNDDGVVDLTDANLIEKKALKII